MTVASVLILDRCSSLRVNSRVSTSSILKLPVSILENSSPLTEIFYFSLRVNNPLLAALLLEISFVEIPLSLLRGVSLLIS
jgi:hypothetical protein